MRSGSGILTATRPVAWFGAGAVFYAARRPFFFSDGELSDVGVPFLFLGLLECFYLLVPHHGP